ncbi:MAG: inorganic phosphate transporter [Verrucomicrobia bacterium]|nr:inorganic phosphate transporter [Verrucomicrobiota bacterium]NCC60593.1 inorganic phosphate transporter [Verrucomicrobiae bacterium]
MILVFCVILIALAFEFINGFHDTANAIATSVSTRALTVRNAIIIASIFNLIGALSGHAVAKTIGKGLVDINFITQETILCALIAGIIWNLVTWFFGIPSSSSHALIGGLCGAALSASHLNWNVIHWSVLEGEKMKGLWPQVIKPIVLAPAAGFFFGFLIMGLLLWLFRSFRPSPVNRLFGKLQILSAMWVSFSHGANDAQKTMGIITLSLVSATTAGTLAFVPEWMDFLKLDAGKFNVPDWVTCICAIAMAAGTAAGGRKIIKTMGTKLVRMSPINGFAAQSASALVIQIASHWGIPLSTTHVISTSIMGVGATKRFSAVKWGVAGHMVWAWILTIPVTSVLAFGVMKLILWISPGSATIPPV